MAIPPSSALPSDPQSAGPADESSTPRPAGARGLILKIAQVVLVIIILALIGYSVHSQWPQVRGTITHMSWGPLALSIGFIVLGILAGVKTWIHLLRAKGIQIPYIPAAQITMIGALGKYLPGSVWSFIMQAQLGLRYGITRSKSLIALLLMTGITIVTGSNLALLALPQFLRSWGPIAWLLLLAPLGLIALYPPILSALARTGLRLLRREDPDVSLPSGEVARAVAWAVLSWLCFGIHTWLLVAALPSTGRGFDALWLSIAATALAMSAGFVAFLLPSGIGVREAAFVAGLAPVMRPGQALAVALVSRLLFTVADVLCATIAAGTARGSLRTMRASEQSEAATHSGETPPHSR